MAKGKTMNLKIYSLYIYIDMFIILCMYLNRFPFPVAMKAIIAYMIVNELIFNVYRCVFDLYFFYLL